MHCSKINENTRYENYQNRNCKDCFVVKAHLVTLILYHILK